MAKVPVDKPEPGDTPDVAVGQRPGDAAWTPAPAGTYADPGYLPDKKKRYPLDTPEHIAAAPGLFAENRDKYTSEQQQRILAAIAAARNKQRR